MTWESASWMVAMACSVRRGLFEMLRQPAQGASPCVVGGVGDVVVADEAVEAVTGVGVAHDLVVDGRAVEGRPQLLDVVHRDRLVEIAEEAQPRRLQSDRLADQRGELGEAGGHDPAPVEADGGAEPASGGDQEGHPASEAETHDANAAVGPTGRPEVVEG